jgi:pyruvate/2-oxoglutarate dehydrogenase complex dihydrolipoamide acyltransferase (E2) component
MAVALNEGLIVPVIRSADQAFAARAVPEKRELAAKASGR